MTEIPKGSKVVTGFDFDCEFVVNVMPLSDGETFHPSFLVVNEATENFSSESVRSLVSYYRKSGQSSKKRLLLKSNHYLVLWDAKDRRLAEGTVLQDRHFSPDWKEYREAERVLIEQLIRTAVKEQIEVWINESMDVVSGMWRLMTPPVLFEVRGDAQAIGKIASQIEAELSPLFFAACRAGKLPGVPLHSRGEADVVLPAGWRDIERYPQRAEVRVKVDGSEDLLEYRYEKRAPGSIWELKEAWRVIGKGRRERLRVPD
jgi:hypothetical protein